MIGVAELIRTKTLIEPWTILEIGSRDGNDSRDLRNEFECPDVWVVEPHPVLAERIRQRYPTFNIVEAAISDDESPRGFYAVDPDQGDVLVGTSSLMRRPLYDEIPTLLTTVECFSGRELFNFMQRSRGRLSIDFCKIDVEGHAYEVIKSFGKRLLDIKAIHTETEMKSVWDGQKLHDEVASLLFQAGFMLANCEMINDGLQRESFFVQPTWIRANRAN